MQSLTHQFLTFCRSKPADEEYCFVNSDICALAQFGQFAGIKELVGSDGTAWFKKHQAIYDVVSQETTFGALADRLEAHLKQES